MCTDELILPLCQHLAPRLSDALVLGVLGTAAKRLEASLRRVRCLLVDSTRNPRNHILTLFFLLYLAIVSFHRIGCLELGFRYARLVELRQRTFGLE
jgi:hypothetical protein